MRWKVKSWENDWGGEWINEWGKMKRFVIRQIENKSGGYDRWSGNNMVRWKGLFGWKLFIVNAVSMNPIRPEALAALKTLPCPTCITGINSICLTGRMNEGFHICWSQSKCFPKIHGACHHCHHIQIYGYLLAWHLATSITQHQKWFVIEICVSMKLSTSSSHESLCSAAAAEHICPKSHAALPVDKFTFCGRQPRSGTFWLIHIQELAVSMCLKN